MKNKILFSSKANALLQLRSCSGLHIPPIYIIDVPQWQKNRKKILQEIITWASTYSKDLAVRSSCSREDSDDASAAGAFVSLLHIPHTHKESIAKAIDSVLASYGSPCAEDQILLQPMVENVAVSGVIMTKVLNDGSPYYAINYDDESGKTDSITGGFGNTKTVYIYRNAKDSDFDSQRLLSFVHLAKKIEEFCGRNDLDIEFCQSHTGVLYVLQVRPICSQQQWLQNSSLHVSNNMDFIVHFVRNRTKAWPELHGKSTILGVMPDWNPAEIIGVTPRPLASSLYRELVTRRIWSLARERMGYKIMPPEELMILLAGRPYIDVRVSLNSFLPAGLHAEVGEILVNAWLEYLDAHPHLHDKIEFDVAQTMLDFCFDTHLETRYPNLLHSKHKKHFKTCLQTLTNNCLSTKMHSSMAQAFAAVEHLQLCQKARATAKNHIHIEEHALVPRMIILCEECKNWGTLPFAILARHAFIAESLLRTLVEREAISAERLHIFKQSLHTVSSELSQDFMLVGQGLLTQEEFLHRYGHLRPSTYDILSPNYANKKDLFLQIDEENFPKLPAMKLETTKFSFTAKEQQAIAKLMNEAGLNSSAVKLEAYARKAIAGREWAKFIFSKNLSQILELIAQWGTFHDFNRDKLSFLDVRYIFEWASHALLETPKKYFDARASEGHKLYTLSRSLKLGYLIRSERDIYIVPQHRSAPNFIGKERVEAPVIYLTAQSSCSMNLTQHIICIENADPGFDWIFTRNIAGLVTKFGGTNSHMAIRCAEYGLPAVIGTGEVLFEKIRTARRCLINAENHTVQVL